MKFWIDEEHYKSLESKYDLIRSNYYLILYDIGETDFSKPLEKSKVLLDIIYNYNSKESNFYNELYHELGMSFENYEDILFELLYTSLDELQTILFDKQDNMNVETFDMYCDFIIRLKIYVSSWRN